MPCAHDWPLVGETIILVAADNDDGEHDADWTEQRLVVSSVEPTRQPYPIRVMRPDNHAAGQPETMFNSYPLHQNEWRRAGDFD